MDTPRSKRDRLNFELSSFVRFSYEVQLSVFRTVQMNEIRTVGINIAERISSSVRLLKFQPTNPILYRSLDYPILDCPLECPEEIGERNFAPISTKLYFVCTNFVHPIQFWLGLLSPQF